VPRRRIEAADFGPQRRLRTFLGRFPEPVPESGPRTFGEIMLPGPYTTVAGAEGLEVTTKGRVGKDRVRVLSPDEPTPTILGGLFRGGRQARAFMVETADGRRRQMTFQEAALAQGFPPDYLFVAGLSRTAKMVGQAIPIYVGRAILKAIVAEHTRRRTSVPALTPESP
jgi:hypothetical protein